MDSQASAALLLLFDIAAAAVAEHDHWHTREHLPERLAVPDFRRGSRWVAASGTPRYLVMYEVRELATLDSPEYLQRLDAPTPWTARMMQHYVGMRRALCRIEAGFGGGLGSTALLCRFEPEPGRGDALRDWLAETVFPRLAQRPGIASARLFSAAATAGMTREQQLRGRDGTIHSAVLVTGYQAEAVAALAQAELHPDGFAAHGAAPALVHLFHMAVTQAGPAAVALEHAPLQANPS